MKKFGAKMTVYPDSLVRMYAYLRGENPATVDFDRAFRSEISAINSSGVSLNKYEIYNKKDREFNIKAVFNIDETILSKKCPDIENAFQQELGWLEESCIYFDQMVIA